MSYFSHSLKQFGIGLEYKTVNVFIKKCNHNFHKYQVSTKKKKHSSGGSGRQLAVLLLPTRGETEEEAPLVSPGWMSRSPPLTSACFMDTTLFNVTKTYTA